MSQTVITSAFEQLKAQEAANGGVVILDEFVFANIPNLDITSPVDRGEGLPDPALIVHRQAVGKTGMVNNNAVVYSVVMGADVGDFDFNWVGLVNSANNVVAMIVHAPTQKKIKTATGQQGNVLTRSFLMEYNGASEQTQIITPADTWQIDFTARLNGVDERIRCENRDIYGAATFTGDGFLVSNNNGQYTVTKGVAYIAGVRAELVYDQLITVSQKPVKVWVDVSWKGTLTSTWSGAVKMTLAESLADYQDNEGKHYVFAVAEIRSDGSVIDLRPSGLQYGEGVIYELKQKQPLSDILTSFSGLEGESDSVPFFDDDNQLRATTLTPFFRRLMAGASTGDVLSALGITLDTPENYGAAGNGINDDTVALRNSVATPYSHVFLAKKYLVSDNIIPAEGVTLFGPGEIIQKSSGAFTWSSANRASDYPIIMVKHPHVTIEGLKFICQFEAIRADYGGDDLVISNIIAGGTEVSRSAASVIALFNIKNVVIRHSRLHYCGNRAYWDTSKNDIKSGTCDGIDFGGVAGISINKVRTFETGRNGINWYGASDVEISGCSQKYCGQSGIQPGPHPDYSGVSISNNNAEYCCADAIDARYTGKSAVDIDMTLTGCRSKCTGMLYGDNNYLSDDGTGVVTLAFVKNVTVSSCTAKEFAGAAVWHDAVSDVTVDGVVAKSTISRCGFGVFSSCNDIKWSNNIVKVKGSAMWFGGGIIVTDFVDNNNKFESTDSFSVLMPNNSLSRMKSNGSTYTGYKTVNLRWNTVDVDIVMNGTDAGAVYVSIPYARHTRLNIVAAVNSNVPVLQQAGAEQSVWNDCSFSNSGGGKSVTVKLTGNNDLTKFTGATRIFATHAESAAALQIDDGPKNIYLDGCSIYGANKSVITTTDTPGLKYNNCNIQSVSDSGESYVGQKPYDAPYTQRK